VGIVVGACVLALVLFIFLSNTNLFEPPHKGEVEKSGGNHEFLWKSSNI
jgi:hypothetical protein